MRGQGIVEYGLILCLTVVLTALILGVFGGTLADILAWIGVGDRGGDRRQLIVVESRLARTIGLLVRVPTAPYSGAALARGLSTHHPGGYRMALFNDLYLKIVDAFSIVTRKARVSPSTR